MQAQSPMACQPARYGRLNQALFLFHAGMALWTLFGAALLARYAGPSWGWTALAPALLANGYWAVLHEALHGNLAHSAHLNRMQGRGLAILFGSSFRVLRFAHLSHHRFNRHPLDRPDAYDPGKTSRSSAYLVFLAHTLGGQYLGEVLLPALFWLPGRARLAVIRRFLSGEDRRIILLREQAAGALNGVTAVREIRTDSALAAVILTASIALWGEAWPFLAAAIALRGLLVSYIDNLYHFRTPIDRPDYAHNLHLPASMRLFILNSNLHQVHHRAMNLPWWSLPGQFAADGDTYHGRFGSVALAQLRGPRPIEQLRSGK